MAINANAPVDDDNIEDDLDEEEPILDEDDSEDESDWVPPTKADYERLQARLTKINAESKRHRLAAKAASTAATAEPDEDAVSKAVQAAEAKFRPMIVNGALRSSLAEAGLLGTPDRLLKLVDISSIEIDEDGSVDSDDLEDIVNELKADYPELFKKTRVGNADIGTPATGRVSKPLTATERQAATVAGLNKR